MVDLLRPLLHHKPVQMLTTDEHGHFLVGDARVRRRDEAKVYLDHLQKTNELNLCLLELLRAWQPLSAAQREQMLSFFERSMLLCRIAERADMVLVSARTRSVPALDSDVSAVVARASHLALYLLPVSHIGIIPQIISRALSKRFAGSHLVTRSGGDTLLVYRQHAAGPCCSVDLFPYDDIHRSRSTDVAAFEKEPRLFSCVLCVASSDFGLFKFVVQCADETMDSCSFGAHFQSWGLRLGPSRQWVQFRTEGYDAEAFDVSSLTGALRKNMHETVAGAVHCLQAAVSCGTVNECGLLSHVVLLLQDTRWRSSLRPRASSSSATRGATARPSS